MCEVLPPTGFYIDPEITRSDTTPSEGEIHPVFMTLPTTNFSTCLLSLPSAEIDDSFLDFPSMSMSYTYVAPILIDPPIVQIINTPQISKFWNLYQEYPEFLKKAKKRNRRKRKRYEQSLKRKENQN